MKKSDHLSVFLKTGVVQILMQMSVSISGETGKKEH